MTSTDSVALVVGLVLLVVWAHHGLRNPDPPRKIDLGERPIQPIDWRRQP